MTTTTTQIKALYPLDLKPGDTFALSLRKNAKTFTVAPNASILPVQKICKENKFSIETDNPRYGMILIILSNCRQLTLNDDAQLFLIN